MAGEGFVPIEDVPAVEASPVDVDEVEEEAVSILSSGILYKPSEFAMRRNVVFSNNTASTAPQARVRVVRPFLRAVLLGTSV